VGAVLAQGRHVEAGAALASSRGFLKLFSRYSRLLLFAQLWLPREVVIPKPDLLPVPLAKSRQERAGNEFTNTTPLVEDGFLYVTDS
jgi:hypothetical protein